MMRHSRLGRSGLTVSALALGTMNFGTHVPEDEAHQLMDLAFEAGVNLIDTADVYGWGENAGLAERIIGRHLDRNPGRRDHLVIATKLYRAMSPGPNHAGLSALHLRRACEASLRRLNVDHIDLYQFHHYDRETPLDETWEACDVLHRQGKVVYFGSSNFAAWQLMEAQAVAAGRGMTGLVSEQTVFNLLTRHAELEVLPACDHLGLGMIAWSPLHDGLLAGPPQAGGRRNEPGNLAARTRFGAVLDKFYRYCGELGAGPARVALAWLRDRPGVGSTVVGPRTAEQLKDALASMEVELGPRELGALDELFPGFRPAAGHYAW